MNDVSQEFEPLPSDQLTWAALLGKWVEFARSAVGLPATEEGELMKASVVDVIMLQAVWFALENLKDLPREEQALGVDRAGVLVAKHVGELERRYDNQDMPGLMVELIDDAEKSLHAAIARVKNFA
ncbi:hypothetical protein JD969_14855 [Planctomycetota bacterium]|nr:hypothetical protein JD969_14855 [Planctomycetota bacterium]